MIENHHMRAAGNAMVWKIVQMGGVKIIYLVRLLVLAILLTPADFGLVAIATAATGFLLSVTNFGLIPAVVQAENMDDKKYDTAWTFDVTRSFSVALLTIIFAPVIAKIFAEPLAVPIIQVLAIRPFFESLISIKMVALNRELSFRPSAYLKIVEAISNTLISVLLAKFFGVWAIVFGYIIGTLSMVIASYMLAPHRPRIAFNWKLVSPLMNFGGWVFLTSLVAMAGNYGVRIAISRQLGADALGLYFIAVQLAYLPNEVANETVGAVAFPLFARLQSNVLQATQVFRTLFSGLAAVIYPVCALMIVLAPTLVHDVLGPSWTGTEQVIQVLSLVVMIGTFGEVAVTVFNGFGQPYRITLLEVIQSSIVISFAWVLTRRFGLVGSAMAWLPAILFSQLLSARYLRNILDHPLRGLQNSLLAILAATGLCFIVAMTVSYLIPGVVGLVAAASLGGMFTILLLWVADGRYKLGFARNLALAFPPFASLLRFMPVEHQKETLQSNVLDQQHKHFVSVIIIFFNASDFLQTAIESVLAQTYGHWELLLVDDGSHDGSTQIAKSFTSKNPTQIKYFEHASHQNLGMSAARNLGICKSKGDYIAFLDADDYWLPNKLEVQTRILDSQPEAGMLFGSTKYWYSWTGRPEDTQRDYVPALRVHTNTLFQPPQLLLLFTQGKAEVPCTCSILVRRAVAEKVGGFEDSFRGMYEDQAFYAKICLSVPVLATEDCLAWYRQHLKSNYSTAAQAGQTHVLRYTFLQWLETYCYEQRVQDKRVWEAVRRQLWLYDSSTHQKLPRFVRDSIRWIKKWILRLEERVLPSILRDRLWLPK